MPKKIDIKKLLRRTLVLGLLGGIAGLFIANKLVKRNGYEDLQDFLENYSANKALVSKADPELIEIDLSDSDYAFIEGKREEALNRGIQINIGNNYVPCQINADGKSIEAEIRLKGHMTDHLEGEKWSYRIKSKEEILGMYRFSLQHPGTRNYAYEWVYHQLLKKEGIIYLNYDFVQLKMRDKDLGIYALEEHFGQHVLEQNDRPKGAILRWNPNLYWEWRINELDGIYLDEEYSHYTSSYAEPYDKGTVRSDPQLLETYQKGAKLLEEFRRGEKETSEVFDVELMAKFHAIIDLVGGYHSLDWSDVKFFYNSETGKVEPVGYESFSIRISERLAGQRIPDDYKGISKNYHDRLFADPIFFTAYIRQIERICEEAYFNDFIQSIKAEHENKLAILAMEWPHRKFSFDPYFENIQLIRNNIQLPKPFHAFIEKVVDDSTFILSMAPVSDFPVQLLNIEIDGKETVVFEDIVLQAKARGTFATYITMEVNHHVKKLKNMIIYAKIPGGTTIFHVEVAEYPSYKAEFENLLEKEEETVSLESHPHIKYAEYDSSYYFDELAISIDQEYSAESIRLKLLPGQFISFTKGSITLSNSELLSIGTHDHEVTINADSQNEVFVFLNSKVLFNNTEFYGGQNILTCSNSDLFLETCTMANVRGNFIESILSSVTLHKCDLGSVHAFGKFDRSMVQMKEVYACKGGQFIDSQGSNIKIISSSISKYEQVFSLNHISILRMWTSNLNDNTSIAELSTGSELNANGSDLGSADNGFRIEKTDEFGAKSVVKYYRSTSDQVKNLETYF